jgi:hypothetical protein
MSDRPVGVGGAAWVCRAVPCGDVEELRRVLDGLYLARLRAVEMVDELDAEIARLGNGS